jgi:hypothetical protein
VNWSKRERRWWIAALASIILVYSTLYFVRGPVEFLRERNLLRLTVGTFFAAAALAVVFYLWKRRVGLREGLVLLVFAMVFGASVLLADLPEEKLHFLEYGLLGALFFHACRERALRRGTARSGAALLAAALTGLAGWGDEGVQGLLPNRHYDLRDILWNLLGGTLVIAALFAADWVRSKHGGLDRPVVQDR